MRIRTDLKNYFLKGGVYSKQFTTIIVLLGILLLSQVSTWIDNIFTPANAAEFVIKDQPLPTTPEVEYEYIDEGGVQFDGPKGTVIMMPDPKIMGEYREFGNELPLEGYYSEGIVRIYVKDHVGQYKYNNPNINTSIREDYRIRLDDDHIEIWDISRNKLVGTLTYKTSLGRMIMSDNEHR
jgi:hypothetical protein